LNITRARKRTQEIIQEFFNFYIIITQNHHKTLLLDKKIHTEWLDIGAKIVNIKEKLYHNNNSQKLHPNVSERKVDEKSIQVQTDAVHKNTLENKILELLKTSIDTNHEHTDFRPIREEETWESCPYCSMFRDIGTRVCPNCGRTLNK